jgi:uncharacterized membrane protein YhaH (DUF805 family)
VNFFDAIRSVLTNYVTFSGRACRSEYWYWVLFAVIASAVLNVLDAAIFNTIDKGPLQAVFAIVTLLPALAVAVRRLHDIDRTGWWLLITFTIVGVFLLLYWACLNGTQGPNRFGPDPLVRA